MSRVVKPQFMRKAEHSKGSTLFEHQVESKARAYQELSKRQERKSKVQVSKENKSTLAPRPSTAWDRLMDKTNDEKRIVATKAVHIETKDVVRSLLGNVENIPDPTEKKITNCSR